MAEPTTTSFSHNNGSNEISDATNNNSQCKCKTKQYGNTEKASQTQGIHYKKLSPKSRGHSLPLSPLVNNLNLYSKKPPTGFVKDVLLTSSPSNTNIEPSFRIGGKTDHYPTGRFSFTHPRFFLTLTNPQFSSNGRGGLHVEERLDSIMSDDSYRALDDDMDFNTKDHPVFYINNSNACDKSGNINLQQSQSANTFTNSISRRRKLTQSLSGLSSPGQVRNKLSPVREYVPSTNSNAGSPTTPTNPLV